MSCYHYSLRPFSTFLMDKLTLQALNLVSFRRIAGRFSVFHGSNPRRILSRSTRAMAGFASSKVEPESKPFPLSVSGVEEALMGFVIGTSRSTEVAHAVWKNVVKKGDTVIDATCGNGHDTLALLKMVSNESKQGCVYGLDIQKSAIESTKTLLEISAEDHERKMVKLFQVCHSKTEEIIPKDVPVRLVAFNLGYLPGGDKTLITTPKTTETALRAASKILDSEGLISIVVYVGHPGGRDELEVVETFASGLPVESWVSCKFETINRPTAPVLVLLFKK